MRTVRPKKALGQHFLRDMDIAQRIAGTVDARADLPILEIGPGTGVLTRFLSQKNRELKVVEIDNESVVYLKTFPGLMSLRVIFCSWTLIHCLTAVSLC